MSEFDPHQLDQLEDALERLDHGPQDLESLELAPELLERLAEYQQVLALCRDAFPLESPPEDVLTVVLDEAREVSRRPRSRDANQRGGWRRFWERWRGTVVPGLALAATAVVVLWVMDPSAPVDSASELSTESIEHHGDAKRERTQPASESSNEKFDGMAKADEPSPEPNPEPPTTPEQLDEPADEPQQTPKPSAGNRPKSKLPHDVPEPEPAPTPMSKDETWTSLERADSERRKGNCDRARSIYDDVIAASSDVQAIAQAKGGIGLCFEQDRRDSEAKKWFEQARATSPSVDAWINRQRDEQPLPGENKKAHKQSEQLFEADNSL